MADKHPERKHLSFSDEVLAEAYEAEHGSSHDQRWAALKASDAPLVRHALLRAEKIRIEGLDPGDAYLEGIAAATHHRDRQELIDSVSGTLAALPETPEVDPPT